MPLLEACGLTPRDRLLPLSCFAVTQTWTPSRLARTTHYKHYRQVAARVLLDAGDLLIPTSVFDDNAPDARNEVHYDLIVISGHNLRLGEFGGCYLSATVDDITKDELGRRYRLHLGA